LLGLELARAVNNGFAMNTNRLATIATRQRQSRTRDFLFAALVAALSLVSLSSVAVAADAAQTTIVAR
jgi:hypothetical protein